MTERGLSEATMLESLHDIRLPADAAGGLAADLLVAIGCGAAAAWAVAAILRFFTATRQTLRQTTLAEEIAHAQALPEAQRRVALLHLLKAHAPERFEALSGALYRPDASKLDDLEAEVARLA